MTFLKHLPLSFKGVIEKFEVDMSAGPETGLAQPQTRVKFGIFSVPLGAHALKPSRGSLGTLQSLLAKDTQHLQTLNTLGLCHYRLKKYDEAVKTFERLVEADPEQLLFGSI